MMKKRNIFHLFLAGVLLSGCSAESEQSAQGGVMPITLGYSVVTTMGQTRAATNLNDTKLSEGIVAVSVKKHANATYPSAKSYNAGTGGVLSPASSQFYYEIDGSSSDIIAYYPSTASSTFFVKTDQTEDANYLASDLMWAQVLNQSPTSNSVNLQFTHLLTKIVVNATAGTGITNITSVTLHNVKRKVTFISSTGGVTLAESDNAPSGISMSNEGAAIIPPQTIDGDFLYIVTPEGTAIYSLENKEFEAGHQYTLNITVNDVAVTTTNAITGWTSEGTVNVYPTASGGGVAKTQYPLGLPGLFTINNSGTKVCFSQGNLQYQASSDMWRFAENQWDYVGNDALGTVYVDETKCNNASVSSTYSGWIDLFGWGTANHSFGSGYNTYYQPWSIDRNGNNYGPSGTSNGLYGTYALADWGSNAISNGGNTASLWRTLTGGTGGEWEWILGPSSSPNPDTNCRTSSTVNGIPNARFAKAKVNEVYGMILFPDTYTHPTDVTAPIGINEMNDTGWNGNSYDATDWTKMESAGAVFLPAAGYRDGTSTGFQNAYGFYWASSPYTQAQYAHYAYFLSSSFGVAEYSNRAGGYSVRLVRKVVE